MRWEIIVSVVSLCLIITSGSISTAKADTLLFPVIAANQPNVTTIVSIINGQSGTSNHLRYTYRYKDTFVGGLPNITGTCASQPFTGPPFRGVLVNPGVAHVPVM